MLAQDAAFAQCRGEPGAPGSVAEAETAAMRSAMTRTFAVSCPTGMHGAVSTQLGALSTLHACLTGCATCILQVVDGEILDRARAEDGRDGSTGLVIVRAGVRSTLVS